MKYAFIIFLSICSIALSAQTQTWTQQGSDIDGAESISLSSNGSTVAIGVPRSFLDTGYVQIFKKSYGIWKQVGSDIDGEAAGDNSGYSVSLSSDGSTVAIGARFNDGNGSNAGHVRIYKNISGTWTQQGSDIDGEAVGDNSGNSVSLSSDGSTVAIGAYLNDGNGNAAGHVRVYKNISGKWTQQGSDIDGEAAGDNSGYSVSLSSDGSTVAIGARFNDGNGSNAGHVRIYKNISGTWTQQGSDIDGEAAGDWSGCYVSLSSDGSIVAIGAWNNDGNGSNAGHVRIYKNISGTWTQQGSDIDGETASDYSGQSVSLSSDGSTVAIGAPYNDGNGTNAGHVRVYKNISGTWTQVGSDINGQLGGSFFSDRFGQFVSLSGDGSTLAGKGTKVRVYSTKTCATTSSIDTITSCDLYTWTNGVTYTISNNTAKDTFVNFAGCDSIISLDLTIVNTDDYILLGPSDQIDLLIGSNVMFATVSPYSANAIFQWQEDDGTGFKNLSNTAQYNGANNDTLLISNLTINNGNNQFRCIVSINNCSDTSRSALLTINIPRYGNWVELGNGLNALNANNEIKTITSDDDGRVYAIGTFTNSDNQPYVARWNDTAWSELGEGGAGLNANGEIQAIFIDNQRNEVLVAGTFGPVSKWIYDKSWTQIAPDIRGSSITVSANGDIYLGYVEGLTGNPSIGFPVVKKYNTSVSDWDRIPDPEGYTGARNSNRKIILGTDNNDVITTAVPGAVKRKGTTINPTRTNISFLTWDGFSQDEIAIDSNSLRPTFIESFFYDKNNILHVAANFTRNPTFNLINNDTFLVARLINGKWEELRSANSQLRANNQILSICEDPFGNIYAAGKFLNSDGKRYVSKWDGSHWGELGFGTSKLLANNDINSVISDINGTIYAAGLFTNTNDKPYVAMFKNQVSSTDAITACDSYTWTNGITYTKSNTTAKDTFVNTTGCDSIVTLDLTINNSDFISQQPTDQSLLISQDATFDIGTSGTPSLTFQWQTDIGTGYQKMSNAGQYSGTQTKNLSISNVTSANNNQKFRCIVNDQYCSDTSVAALLSLYGVSVDNLRNNQIFHIYPNPASNELNIKIESNLLGSQFRIINTLGQEIKQGELSKLISTIDVSKLPKGSYNMLIGTENYSHPFLVE